jgi:AmpE protein
MTFLAIIAAVLLLQVWGTAERVHFDGWFANWQTRVTAWGLPGAISLALLVFTPSLLAIFALSVVHPILFGLPWLLLATLLLLYAFGRGDFQALMGRYRGHAYSGDFEAAYLAACADFDWENSDEGPDTAPEVHARIQRALLYEGLQRWFAVLLYFVLLGPAAALVYRLLQLCRGSFEPELVARCLFLLDWLPARLLAATFALTGDFIGSRETLLAALQNKTEGAGTVLYTVGEAALGSGASGSVGDEATFGPMAAAQNREFDALLSRSAVCWIVALSLLVLLF